MGEWASGEGRRIARTIRSKRSLEAITTWRGEEEEEEEEEEAEIEFVRLRFRSLRTGE
jgi:hypothetical protein